MHDPLYEGQFVFLQRKEKLLMKNKELQMHAI